MKLKCLVDLPTHFSWMVVFVYIQHRVVWNFEKKITKTKLHITTKKQSYSNVNISQTDTFGCRWINDFMKSCQIEPSNISSKIRWLPLHLCYKRVFVGCGKNKEGYKVKVQHLMPCSALTTGTDNTHRAK